MVTAPAAAAAKHDLRLWAPHCAREPARAPLSGYSGFGGKIAHLDGTARGDRGERAGRIAQWFF